MEVAARLEYMAEARGMPRPGHAHADAEAEDVADVTGGDARDSDADFEQDAALPGGDGQTEENEAENTLD